MTDVSPSIATRMSEMAAEIIELRAKLADLRAKLAEVEAERDGWEREHDAAVDEWRRAEARLAEVEHERDARTTWDVFGDCLGNETRRRKAAEAKLAAVLALCDEFVVISPYAGEEFRRRVRAALAGDDRG